ncbi:glutamine-hydrolyzing carbamoyl-phosphate synthase small subunit [Sutterella sp.]|uniref:glutamine-hydrolyzing carbamoyl-phosphate synthase small subunit n=1 Tax=Sutterella sp. TaxID=1981025 RepID=UPI0026E0C63A|nr:glutamine-hydrolyzing carbamoyl-phosphate synthase small subunit [Sutterella sp.]MDO5531973.1 glutamine-hydrolyzing carbamoyl-phosphate synthase small subunit [Sutterella sp.]
MALIAHSRPAAALVLADGAVFQGEAIGASGLTVGEVVFNTSMTGYQEILTDPSYTGQLVTLTCAHIGNVGVNPEDMESRSIHAAGLIVKAATDEPSNWRAKQSLPAALKAAGIKAIAGVDTRALTIHLRTTGAQAGAILCAEMGQKITDEDIAKAREAALAWGSMAGQDLAQTVTTDKVYEWTEGSWEPSREGEPAGFRQPVAFPYHVVAYDFGIKTNILRLMADRGIRVTVVPAKTPFEEAMAYEPDGLFLSNGPGDPAPCDYAIKVAQQAIAAKIPLFGICLGHQIMGLAVGAKTLKMKFGHHGANHPVENIETKRVAITSQNHGFAVDASTLPANARATHRSLFDGSLQGFCLEDAPAFCFQGHPEASPGPHDIDVLFEKFAKALAERRRA